jgi:hypothetical protein
MQKHAIMLSASSMNCKAHALRRVAVLLQHGTPHENRSGSDGESCDDKIVSHDLDALNFLSFYHKLLRNGYNDYVILCPIPWWTFLECFLCVSSQLCSFLLSLILHHGSKKEFKI